MPVAVKPLVRVLAEAGFGSRRRVTEIIKQGRVSVNGVPAESFTMTVDTDKDSIQVGGHQVDSLPKETVCLMLNKPAGVISTVKDERDRKTVIDILPPEYRKIRLYPVGRLDSETTGLLLLTNDGDLTYRLTHPGFEYEKEYIVRVAVRLTRQEMERLEEGIKLEDGVTSPAQIKMDTSLPRFSYNLVIHEGRKRQVRRMFERLGHPVLELKRVRFGGLELGSLKEGEIRKLKKTEIKRLLKR